MNTPLIEACVDSYASCRAAYRGGADRLELCAHLVIGGTTPSTALFRQVQRDIPVKTNILIRPRFGDFLYSKEELERAKGTFTPSAFVSKITGVDNVCERSASLAGDGGTFIMRKQAAEGVTAACTIKKWSVSFE